jgi:transketolase N-terminal domain/subunit
LSALEKKVLWLATWTIHHANYIRENSEGLKVGGHQASSASLATIMTALYFKLLRPQDRVAVKPHASPIFHAIQYLLGRQTLNKLELFRGYKGAQSYPSRSKDTDDVDFSTGSVGLGVAQTLFSSLVQDYVRAHGWGTDKPEGRMIALVGDAERDEGNIFEAMLEGWKQGLRNCWWIIDYNRQSLDAVRWDFRGRAASARYRTIRIGGLPGDGGRALCRMKKREHSSWPNPRPPAPRARGRGPLRAAPCRSARSASRGRARASRKPARNRLGPPRLPPLRKRRRGPSRSRSGSCSRCRRIWCLSSIAAEAA